jgi:hypothetical protein
LNKGVVLAGIFSAGMGLLIVFLSIGIIPAEDSSFSAPRWIAGLAGLVFILGGFGVLLSTLAETSDWSDRFSTVVKSLQSGVGIIIFVIMAGIANWVAFGSGDRSFSGSASGSSFAVDLTSGELVGRIVFGIGAVLLDLIIVLGLITNIIRFVRRF